MEAEVEIEHSVHKLANNNNKKANKKMNEQTEKSV